MPDHYYRNYLIQNDARFGELGELANRSGQVSTELSHTLFHPELGFTNIPVLVKGQRNIPSILNNERLTPEQMDIAVQRAIERKNQGARLPNFFSMEAAEEAAKQRSLREKQAPFLLKDSTIERMLNIYRSEQR